MSIHPIPYSWDRRTYLDYCDSIMMVHNCTVKRLYYKETGFKIHSLSQFPKGLVRKDFISYFEPNQLRDLEILNFQYSI